MKVQKNNKKWITAALALGSIALLAGTFAWFTSQDSAKNHFEGSIAGNDVEVVETFTSPKDWKPGQEVNKDVAILNSGDYESMIRVSFKEILSKLTDATSKTSSDVALLNGKKEEQIYLYPLNGSAIETGTWTDSKVTAKTLTVTGGDYAGTYNLKAKEQAIKTDGGSTFRYVSYWENGTKKYYAKVGSYSRDAAGQITPEITEFKYVDLASTPIEKDWSKPVYKPTLTIDEKGKAVVNANSDDKIQLNFINLAATPTANKWYYNANDGHFYYVGLVAPQVQTAQLLDSVTLAKTADNSYSKLNLDLIVNAKGIQAEKEAIDSTDWLNNTDANLTKALEALFK